MHAVQYVKYSQIHYQPKRLPRMNEQRLKLLDVLPVHSGCVNSIAWDDNGRYLVSGSDDRNVVVTDPLNEPDRRLIARIPTVHRGNIFSAKFLPGAETVVSCASDGSVIVNDVELADESASNLNVYTCNGGATYEVCAVGIDPWTFITCSEDGTIRWVDRRLKSQCAVQCSDDVVVRCQRAVNAVDVSVFRPYLLAAGCSDATVRLYDLRCVTKGTKDDRGIAGLQSCFISPSRRPGRVTSVDVSRIPGEDHVLASFSSDSVYSFAVKEFANEEEKVSLSALSSAEEQQSVRKVRLRGDWTDTGPRSRPSVAAAGQRQMVDGDHGGSVDAVEENSGISRLSQALTNLFSRQAATAESGSSTSRDGSGGTAAGEVSESQRRRDECRSRLLEEARRRCEERRRQLAEVLDAIPQHRVSNAYNGHRNARTVLKQAAFWGADHIVSGSDCGHVFIWNRHTGRVSNILEADRHVVNCVQPHPSIFVLATSGIDYDIKLWAPLEAEPVDRSQEMSDLVERNKLMLEETRDTVTIPAAFMLRMIAAMNRYRRERRVGSDDEDSDST